MRFVAFPGHSSGSEDVEVQARGGHASLSSMCRCKSTSPGLLQVSSRRHLQVFVFDVFVFYCGVEGSCSCESYTMCQARRSLLHPLGDVEASSASTGWLPSSTTCCVGHLQVLVFAVFAVFCGVEGSCSCESYTMCQARRSLLHPMGDVEASSTSTGGLPSSTTCVGLHQVRLVPESASECETKLPSGIGVGGLGVTFIQVLVFVVFAVFCGVEGSCSCESYTMCQARRSLLHSMGAVETPSASTGVLFSASGRLFAVCGEC